MLMMRSTKERGGVELQLLEVKMLVVCVCERASQGHKWVGERAKYQRHQSRAPADHPWWQFCHPLHGFPPRCPHKCATRWMSERKMPRGEWMDWKCWRQGQGEWRVKNKVTIRFLPWPCSSHAWRSEWRWKKPRGGRGGLGRWPKMAKRPPNSPL